MALWVNIGSGNGLLPDGTKPSPEPMMTYFPRSADELNPQEVFGDCTLRITTTFLRASELWQSTPP